MQALIDTTAWWQGKPNGFKGRLKAGHRL